MRRGRSPCLPSLLTTQASWCANRAGTGTCPYPFYLDLPDAPLRMTGESGFVSLLFSTSHHPGLIKFDLAPKYPYNSIQTGSANRPNSLHFIADGLYVV